MSKVSPRIVPMVGHAHLRHADPISITLGPSINLLSKTSKVPVRSMDDEKINLLSENTDVTKFATKLIDQHLAMK